MALTVLLFAALAVALVLYGFSLVEWLWARPDGLLLYLWYAFAFLFLAVTFLVGAGLLPTIVTAPITDPMSERAESLLTSAKIGGGGLGRLISESAQSVIKTVLRGGVLLFGHALLLLLWLVPVVGHAIWTGLSLLWTISWLAHEYLDVCANRHGYSFGQTLAVVRGNYAACLGLGGSISLLLWIPLANALFVPLATVAGTLVFVELRASGRIAAPNTEEES